MKRSLIVGLCALSVLLLAQSAAFAIEYAPMTATVVAMKGEVYITKSGATTPFQAKIGDLLAKGDAIETKADGGVDLKTENGNVVNLGPKSQITISELSLNRSTGDYQTSMDSKFGKIMAKVEAKIKDHATSKFEIKTPTAVCGARGTVFYVVVGENGATQVFVAAGSVDMSDATGQNTFVVVENAAAAVTAAGGAVTELTGAAKDAIVAEYNATLAGEGGTGGEGPGQNPNAPDQSSDPQSLTEVTPAKNPSKS